MILVSIQKPPYRYACNLYVLMTIFVNLFYNSFTIRGTERSEQKAIPREHCLWPALYFLKSVKLKFSKIYVTVISFGAITPTFSISHKDDTLQQSSGYIAPDFLLACQKMVKLTNNWFHHPSHICSLLNPIHNYVHPNV